MQGEDLNTIAAEYHFADWRTIYDDAANEHFRALRADPHVIFPGDKIFIPERQTKTVSRVTEQRHRFKIKAPKSRIRIKVVDFDDHPLAGKQFDLQVDEELIQGQTAADGMVDQTIPVDAQEATLTVWLDPNDRDQRWVWPLKIAHLDPVEKMTGIQARLNNLGFDAGEVDGQHGPQTQAAIKRFQKAFGLNDDGVADSQTQAKLKELHGC